jgi:hypothetical protein
MQRFIESKIIVGDGDERASKILISINIARYLLRDSCLI